MERLKDDAAVSDLGLRRIKIWGRIKTCVQGLGRGGPALRRFGPAISC